MENFQQLLDLFKLGGPVMWLLLAASILSLAVILDRLVTFFLWHQSIPRLLRRIEPLILQRAWAKVEKLCRGRGPGSSLVRVYLRERRQPKEIRDDLLKREGSIVLGILEKRLRWLAVLAQVSTLLGLLGTFHVMIVRFHDGQAQGGQVGPADFSAAIWEALLTTMYGLLIAIPCSAAYQVLEAQMDGVARQMGILVSYLDEWTRKGNAEPVPDNVNDRISV